MLLPETSVSSTGEPFVFLLWVEVKVSEREGPGANAFLLLTKLWVDTGDEAVGEEGGRPTNLTLLLWKTVLRGRVALSPFCTLHTWWRAHEGWCWVIGRGRQFGTWRRDLQGGQCSLREVQVQGREGEERREGWWRRGGQVEQEADDEEFEEWDVAVVQAHPGCNVSARRALTVLVLAMFSMFSKLLRIVWRRRCQ